MNPVHAYSFETTGVAVIRNAISPEQVATARTAVESNWAGKAVPWKFPVLHLGRIFWELMIHPALLELSHQFAGENFRMDHAFGVSSNGAIAQLHGGPQSSQYSCFYHTLPSGERQGLAGQLNFGFALHGQTPETGGFCYIPGSHKSADPRAGREVLAQVYDNKFDHHSIVVPTLHPGDMILFTEGLVHGDTGWRDKSRQRMQIYYKMTPGFMCWRDPAQSEHIKKYAETPLEQRLIEPPWTGRYSEDAVSMGFDNERRLPTREL